MRRAAALLLLVALAGPGEALAQRRRIRQPCASHGMSCEPGPCCRGTKCDDSGVCRRPEKEWSTGPKPGEWTPDYPRPLDKADAPRKKK